MERYKIFKGYGNRNRQLQQNRQLHQNNQQAQRNLILEKQRCVASSPEAELKPSVHKKKSRLDLLKEWKEKKKQTEKDQKKPPLPFYAGKMHTTATGSPIQLAKTSIQKNGAITRSQTQRSRTLKTQTTKPIMMTGIKKIVNKRLQSVKGHAFGFTLTIPESPKITKSIRKHKSEKIDGNTLSKKKLLASSKTMHKVTNLKKIAEFPAETLADLGVAAIEYSPDINIKTTHKEKLEIVEGDAPPKKKLLFSPKPTHQVTEADVAPIEPHLTTTKFTHLEYSPNITVGRGAQRRSRNSARNSCKINVDDEIVEEEIKNNSRIHAFRLFLSNETNRLCALSSKWEEYMAANPSMPEDAKGDVNAVIGKTKLLTTDKFKQFNDLISKCVAGDPKIKVDDLQGFQDWVSLEVEDLDKVYMQLEESRTNNWVPKCEQAVDVVKKPLVKGKKRVNKPAAGSRSALMAHIQAKRKMMQGNMNSDTECTSAKNDVENVNPATEDTATKKDISKATTVAISPRHVACHVLTPLSTKRTSTPRDKSNLRVQVLCQNSGLLMLAATAMARNSLSPTGPTTVLPSPLQTSVEVSNVPANSHTPKSILRKAIYSSAKKYIGFAADPKYFMPQSESSEGSPEILDLITTPVRRSVRLAAKSAEKGLKLCL